MLHIALCDDNPRETSGILLLLTKYNNAQPEPRLTTQTFANGGELLKALDKGQTFDLLLLDIIMPGMNGIELAGKIRLLDADIPLVFLTTSADYALEAFNVSATHYIVKPVNENALYSVLDKAAAKLNPYKKEERSLLLFTPDEKVAIPFSSIICVECERHTLRVYLTDGTVLQSKAARVSFDTAITPLLEDERFLHAHKSYVFNMSLVDKLTASSFVMRGGLEVPVPRYKYADAKKAYFYYLSSHDVGFLGN